MNKLKATIFIIMLLILILTIFNIFNKYEKIQYIDVDVEVGVVGDNFSVTRALVAKMLALASGDKSEINSLEFDIPFLDVSSEDWYGKYVNYVYQNGVMLGVNEIEFKPEENVTVSQAQYLLEKYNNDIKIKITDENKDKPITYSLWLEIYKKIINSDNIEEEEIVILGVNLTELEGYTCATDKGIFSFEGLDINNYENKLIKVLKKDNEILIIEEVLNITPTLTYCYISNFNNNYLTIFINGIQKTFNISDEININENIGEIADITIDNENVIKIEFYEEYIRGNVNLILDNVIRINNTNYIKDNDIKIYSTLQENVKTKNIESLIIGQNIAKYFLKENKICAIIIDEEASIENVRVAITTDNFEDIFFDNIKINSEGGLRIYVKGEEKIYEGDYTLEIYNDQDFNIGEKEIIKVEALNSEFTLNLIGLKRGYENPSYKGFIEICKINGKYLIINEVNLEDYIKSVICSNEEIPKEDEVIKAISIILRSNTINKINENCFYEYSANFDDSSNFQVYNNLKLDTSIESFVESTRGLVAYSDENIVNLNYFGYSGGSTGNSGEIWPEKTTLEFPTKTLAHLKSVYLFEENIFDNLEEEINANIFFKTKDINCIESDSSWFRWSSSINLNEDLIKNLVSLYEAYPNFIKTLQEDGTYKSKEIGNINNILDVQINKRGEGGNIMEIEIFTDTCQIILMTDTVIKKLFNVNYIINNNGERIENINNLPSSYFVFDKVYNDNENLETLNFYGGGYGHGVGLSIYGAKKLAEQGKKYLDILNTFYSNISINNY